MEFSIDKSEYHLVATVQHESVRQHYKTMLVDESRGRDASVVVLDSLTTAGVSQIQRREMHQGDLQDWALAAYVLRDQPFSV